MAISESYEPLSPFEPIGVRQPAKTLALDVRHQAKTLALIDHFQPVDEDDAQYAFVRSYAVAKFDRPTHRRGREGLLGAQRVGDLFFAALPALAYPLALVGVMAAVVSVRDGNWAYVIPGTLAALGFSLIGFAAQYTRRAMRKR